jgi:hypothetical protein
MTVLFRQAVQLHGWEFYAPYTLLCIRNLDLIGCMPIDADREVFSVCCNHRCLHHDFRERQSGGGEGRLTFAVFITCEKNINIARGIISFVYV